MFAGSCVVVERGERQGWVECVFALDLDFNIEGESMPLEAGELACYERQGGERGIYTSAAVTRYQRQKDLTSIGAKNHSPSVLMFRLLAMEFELPLSPL